MDPQPRLDKTDKGEQAECHGGQGNNDHIQYNLDLCWICNGNGCDNDAIEVYIIRGFPKGLSSTTVNSRHPNLCVIYILGSLYWLPFIKMRVNIRCNVFFRHL